MIKYPITTCPPVYITSRLLPGVKIGDVIVSIGYADRPGNNGRIRYTWYIEGTEGNYEGDNIQCPPKSTLQDGLRTLISFLSAFAEDMSYLNKETWNLFPVDLAHWAVENADKFAELQCELREKELIKE